MIAINFGSERCRCVGRSAHHSGAAGNDGGVSLRRAAERSAGKPRDARSADRDAPGVNRAVVTLVPDAGATSAFTAPLDERSLFAVPAPRYQAQTEDIPMDRPIGTLPGYPQTGTSFGRATNPGMQWAPSGVILIASLLADRPGPAAMSWQTSAAIAPQHALALAAHVVKNGANALITADGSGQVPQEQTVAALPQGQQAGGETRGPRGGGGRRGGGMGYPFPGRQGGDTGNGGGYPGRTTGAETPRPAALPDAAATVHLTISVERNRFVKATGTEDAVAPSGQHTTTSWTLTRF